MQHGRTILECKLHGRQPVETKAHPAMLNASSRHIPSPGLSACATKQVITKSVRIVFTSTQKHAQIRKTRQGGVDAALIQALDAAAAAKDRGLCVVRAKSQLAFSLGLKLSSTSPGVLSPTVDGQNPALPIIRNIP